MAVKVDDSFKEELMAETLKVEIKTALDNCEELKDDAQRNIFKTILKTLQFMIGNGQSHTSKVENVNLEEQNVSEPIQKLCNALQINHNQAVSVFNFNDDSLTLNAIVEGKNAIEKQLNSTLSILTAYYHCYGKDQIKSKELSQQLKWLGIKSIPNLAKNLKRKEHEPLIEVRGTGSELIYKIKRQGIVKGEKIIKDLSSNYA